MQLGGKKTTDVVDVLIAETQGSAAISAPVASVCNFDASACLKFEQSSSQAAAVAAPVAVASEGLDECSL
jgi:hypothetical protein